MSTQTVVLTAVAAPFVIAVVVLCLRNPMGVGLPLFAAAVPFGKGLTVGPSAFGSVSSLIGMVVVAGLVVQIAGSRRSAPSLVGSVGTWVLFLGMATASVLWSVNRAASVSGVMVLASLVLLYALAVTAAVDASVIRRIETGILVGSSLAVGYGLYQLIVLGGFPGNRGGPIAVDGRFGNDLLGPDIQSVTLLMALVIALSRAAGSRVSWRVTYLAVAALTMVGIFMTASRTGSLAAVAVVVTLMATGPRQHRQTLVGFLATLVVAGAVVWIYHPWGIAYRTFETATSSSGRTDIWRVGLTACKEYCLHGSGWGTYPDVYASIQATVPGAHVLVGAGGSYQAHNVWLLVAVELGIVGFLLLAYGLGAALVTAFRLPRALRGVPASLMVGLLIGLVFLSSMEFKFFWLVLILVTLYRTVAAADASSLRPGLDETTSRRVAGRP